MRMASVPRPMPVTLTSGRAIFAPAASSFFKPSSEQVAYIEGNLRTMQDYLAQHLPQIKVVPPEGTYLIWLDCRALELDKADLRRLMLREARVYLDEGYIFGDEGEGFERINIACPRSILVEALERIRKAVASRAAMSNEQ